MVLCYKFSALTKVLVSFYLQLQLFSVSSKIGTDFGSIELLTIFFYHMMDCLCIVNHMQASLCKGLSVSVSHRETVYLIL